MIRALMAMSIKTWLWAAGASSLMHGAPTSISHSHHADVFVIAGMLMASFSALTDNAPLWAFRPFDTSIA